MSDSEYSEDSADYKEGYSSEEEGATDPSLVAAPAPSTKISDAASHASDSEEADGFHLGGADDDDSLDEAAESAESTFDLTKSAADNMLKKIKNLSDLTKDNQGRPTIAEIYITAPEDRQTSQVMSRFEMTEYVSIRARDGALNNSWQTDISGLDDPIAMAKRELMHRKSPLMLTRFVGYRTIDGKKYKCYEKWQPNEMIFSIIWDV